MEKSILITGCSSGIGLCAAQELKKRGYRVFATARKTADVEKLNSLGLESLPLDINDSDAIRKTLAEILRRTGGTLYALFNNSGYFEPGAVEDVSRDRMRIQFETNVFGPMELTNLVLPIMRKQGYGRIIQNSSILGTITLPYYGAYNASKFALEGFNNTLRLELRGTNIFVSIIAPGPIESKFRENAFQHYQKVLSDKPSVHINTYKQLEKTYFANSAKRSSFSLPPTAVVKKLILALESKHPKAHYYIGFPAQLFAFLRRILPESAMDWLAVKI